MKIFIGCIVFETLYDHYLTRSIPHLCTTSNKSLCWLFKLLMFALMRLCDTISILKEPCSVLADLNESVFCVFLLIWYIIVEFQTFCNYSSVLSTKFPNDSITLQFCIIISQTRGSLNVTQYVGGNPLEGSLSLRN